MRSRIIGAYALLSAGVAQAEPAGELYASAGDWEITTADHQTCLMKRSFVIRDSGDEQDLVIFYNATKGAGLGWGTRKPKFPPLTNSLDFDLSFNRKSSSRNGAWGSQPFNIDKIGDEYRFGHVFRSSAESDRFLRDVASNDIVALWFGPTLMMALPLNASDAVKKLQDCSSKADS